MHSVWSDGAETLASIVEACLARGHRCAGITDHSYGLSIAGGMTMAQVAKQHAEIDAINRELKGSFRIFKGIEANIRQDGTVDMERARAATLRVRRRLAAFAAAEDRRSDGADGRCGGAARRGDPRAPAGAKVQRQRPGVKAHWDKVFKVAAKRQVAIEIDGSFDRQDVHYELAARALELGCLFALDSDAHAHAGAGFHRDRDRARATGGDSGGSDCELLAGEEVSGVGAGRLGSVTSSAVEGRPLFVVAVLAFSSFWCSAFLNAATRAGCSKAVRSAFVSSGSCCEICCGERRELLLDAREASLVALELVVVLHLASQQTDHHHEVGEELAGLRIHLVIRSPLIGRGRRLRRPFIEFDERNTWLHQLADAARDRSHAPITRGSDGELHLHRLEDDEHVAGGDRLTRA